MIRIVAVPLVRSALVLAVLALGLCGACTRPAPVTDRQAELAALDPEARRLFSLVEQNRYPETSLPDLSSTIPG